MTPTWLTQLTSVASSPSGMSDGGGSNPVVDRHADEGTPTRAAAVLVLFGGSPEAEELPPDADVLLTQRASTLRQHSGQIAFPGGSTDDTDDGPVHTALREAEEETGLDPSGVRPLVVMSGIFVPPSGFDVTPVLAYWDRPSPVRVVDSGETERVVRVPIKDLIDPANRFQVRHPLGYQGPAFAVDGMLVWGFTGGILAGLLAVSGWETGWNTEDVRDLGESLSAVGAGPLV